MKHFSYLWDIDYKLLQLREIFLIRFFVDFLAMSFQ